MRSKSAKIIYLGIFSILLLGNEPIANSGFGPAKDLGGLNVVPGAYIITAKKCDQGKSISIDPETRLKMQLIVKPKETYFFRRIDSKCTYMQYVSIKTGGDKKLSVFYQDTKKLGNCYFKPQALVKKPLQFSEIKTEVNGKELKIHWAKNPSLIDCNGKPVTWVFKRLKKYYLPKSKSLAKNPLYGTL